MARVTVEDCLRNVDNRFELVHLTAKRVRQLRKGAEPLVGSNNTDTVEALREIAAGKVFRRDEDEQQKLLIEDNEILEAKKIPEQIDEILSNDPEVTAEKTPNVQEETTEAMKVPEEAADTSINPEATAEEVDQTDTKDTLEAVSIQKTSETTDPEAAVEEAQASTEDEAEAADVTGKMPEEATNSQEISAVEAMKIPEDRPEEVQTVLEATAEEAPEVPEQTAEKPTSEEKA